MENSGTFTGKMHIHFPYSCRGINTAAFGRDPSEVFETWVQFIVGVFLLNIETVFFKTFSQCKINFSFKCGLKISVKLLNQEAIWTNLCCYME